MATQQREGGFTLIELSIVLVIIGLIVGGVLVGQNLIAAAALRATIAQTDKFNTSANAFREKYGFLPGDMNQAAAIQFNFPPYDVGVGSRFGTKGRGDGNGILDAFSTSAISNPSIALCGETAMFWGDLGYAGMIDGNFAADQMDASLATSTITNIDSVLPGAKLGGGNYFMVYGNNSFNYFGIISVSSILATNCVYSPGTPGLTVAQAYAIDAKIDDGQPQAGRVTAQYPTWSTRSVVWAAGGGGTGIAPGNIATPSANSCYDNGGNASNTMAYSMTTSNGANVNCAISFRMQAGD